MGKLEELKEQREILYKRMSEIDKTIESLANAQWFLEEGEDVWFVDQFGNIQWARWGNQAWSDIAFTQGHIFETEKGARLEAQRRNLLQRFKMFRDKCNGDWNPNWTDDGEPNFYIFYDYESGKMKTFADCNTERNFPTFGYFKYDSGCRRAIELFGDEIKELFVDCEG